MVEREKLELEARLLTLELVVTRIAAIQLITVSDERFDEFAQSWLDSADEAASSARRLICSNYGQEHSEIHSMAC